MLKIQDAPQDIIAAEDFTPTTHDRIFINAETNTIAIVGTDKSQLITVEDQPPHSSI